VKRPRDFSLPQIVLDRTSRVSLQRQVYSQIATAIRGGAIGPQVRLPSTRLLAKLLCVSRNTVLAAYEDLAADDLIRGEQGAGMRVSAGAPVPQLGLRQVMREAQYPERIVLLEDVDGNRLFINF
jgi:DNA-binding FadR family transcriptional regulator